MEFLKGVNNLTGWLKYRPTDDYPPVNELEMSDILSFTVDGIKKPREVGIMEWIFQLKLTPRNWKGSEKCTLH